MKEIKVETLVMKCIECVGAAVNEIESVGENRMAATTHFINASNNMGKYHAFMEILEKLDMDQFVMCHERCKAECNKVLQGMEKLYDMMGAK